MTSRAGARRLDLWAALCRLAAAAGLPPASDPLGAAATWEAGGERRMAVLAFLPLVDGRVSRHMAAAVRRGDAAWEAVAGALSYLDRWGRDDPIYARDVDLVLGDYRLPAEIEAAPLPREGGARYLKLAAVLARSLRNGLVSKT